MSRPLASLAVSAAAPCPVMAKSVSQPRGRRGWGIQVDTEMTQVVRLAACGSTTPRSCVAVVHPVDRVWLAAVRHEELNRKEPGGIITRATVRRAEVRRPAVEPVVGERVHEVSSRAPG